MKIYTKTGDGGTTSLFGGKRVEKSSARIAAYGTMDELNSLIGTIVAEIRHSGLSRIDSGVASLPRMTKQLLRVQGELFILGADLATPMDVKTKVPRVTRSFATRLEKEIDRIDRGLPKLRNFILPGGSSTGSKLHLARATARRAERAIVVLADEEKINAAILPYINRLSDWLFVLARYVNKLDGQTERIWKGRSKT